jgi:hypothetical protein
MKHLFFKMVIVSTLIISALNSCSKHEYLPAPNPGGTSRLPVVLDLTTSHWEVESDGVLVNTFENVISGTPNYVKVFLEENGSESLIDHPVRWQNGAIWATSTQTDVKIYFRGTRESALYANIRVIIG